LCRYWAADGGILSYGVDTPDILRRSAGYVDRILKGGETGRSSSSGSCKIRTGYQLKTSKAVGMNIKESFLARADEVIE
jgi:putative ABC transport system substrate-binding protein